MDIKEIGWGRSVYGFTWLRTETVGWLSWTREETSGSGAMELAD
jgi:hypothetical protein